MAQVGFFKLKDIGGKDAYIDKILIICAPIMFLGFLSTFLIPETKNRSLEEWSNENQIGFVSAKARRSSIITKEMEAKS